MRVNKQKPVIDGQQRPNQYLSDFIAPKDSGIKDYGMFAVTAGLGIETRKTLRRRPRRLQQHHVEIASRSSSKAFAEYLHERVRKDLWGYAADEALSNEELIKESYPAFAQRQAIQLVQNTRLKPRCSSKCNAKKSRCTSPNHGL